MLPINKEWDRRIRWAEKQRTRQKSVSKVNGKASKRDLRGKLEILGRGL